MNHNNTYRMHRRVFNKHTCIELCIVLLHVLGPYWILKTTDEQELEQYIPGIELLMLA